MPIQIKEGFAVVELFTSEGCSSCPPADEVAIEISHAYKNKVFVLGFHVDYWDRLGWKDAFSNAAYSRRQQQYGSILNLNSIYTPQVIVNGKEEFVGSDKIRLMNTIDEELKKTSVSKIELKATRTDNKTVTVIYKTTNGSSNLVNFALIELQGQSDVKRGENAGKRLIHINIVRDFRSINNPNEEGNISLSVPGSFSEKDFNVIAYTQDKNDWHITGVTQTEIKSTGKNQSVK